MGLDKIDLIYKGGLFHFFKENHYEIFAKILSKHVDNNQDLLVLKNWEEIRENSLIIAYDYDGLHQDIIDLTGKNANKFFRRIFVINWREGHFNEPQYYKNKSFAGNLLSRSYQVLMENWDLEITQADFIGDILALDNLRINNNDKWYLGGELTYGVGYEVVYCGIDILKVLGIYINEYMEKYDTLKHIDKFTDN